MLLYDNHNHSRFSFDGKKASVEDSARSAMSKGLAGIAFSDHCDFFVPEMKAAFEDRVSEVFDVVAQQAEIERVKTLLTEENGTAGSPVFRILKGIEAGLHEDCHEQISDVLRTNSFDQVIASVHYLDGVDPFYGGYYEGKDWKTAYGHYLETIYKEMTWLGDFDIMGHYDYVVRYAPYPENCMRYRAFSDIFDEMFRYLIREGKALEINTKSYREHRGREVILDTEVLKRYHELGGEVISLGSDSHDPQQVGYRFSYFTDLLKSLGFRWTAHYESRRLVQLPL